MSMAEQLREMASVRDSWCDEYVKVRDERNELDEELHAVREALADFNSESAAIMARRAAEEIERLSVYERRYLWLRNGNAFAPEEEHIRGGEDLDALCDANTGLDAPLILSEAGIIHGFTCRKCGIWYAGPNGFHDCAPTQIPNLKDQP